MSHFYASIQGHRGEATRQGTKSSGISGHIRGWSIGAKVFCHYDPKRDIDIVEVYRTGGSNGRESEKRVARFIQKPYRPTPQDPRNIKA